MYSNDMTVEIENLFLCEFPAGPVIKTRGFHRDGPNPIPGRELTPSFIDDKTLHAETIDT